jgi:putative transposase
MESLWGALKNELVHYRRFATRAKAVDAITEWIELFYNRHRRQAHLGYLSPVAYARTFYQDRRAA